MCTLNYLFRDKQLAEIDQAVNALKTMEDSDSILNFNKDESFLLVYQSRLQSDWLQRFGNTVTPSGLGLPNVQRGNPCVSSI